MKEIIESKLNKLGRESHRALRKGENTI
jgi:hypothetical protein